MSIPLSQSLGRHANDSPIHRRILLITLQISLIVRNSLIKKRWRAYRKTTELQHSFHKLANDFGRLITSARTPIDNSSHVELPHSTHISNCILLSSVIRSVVGPTSVCRRELSRDEDTETCCPLLLH